MMRLVLDTNIVVSALLWNGAPAQLLASCRSGDARLFTSAPLIAELADTLSRPKFHKRVLPTLRSVDQLVYRYSVLAALVIPVPTPRLAPDPDDDVVIGTALGAHADLLVTGDHALLSVSTFEGGRIASVQDAIRYIHAG